jgi:hypothetical protein
MSRSPNILDGPEPFADNVKRYFFMFIDAAIVRLDIRIRVRFSELVKNEPIRARIDKNGVVYNAELFSVTMRKNALPYD